MGVFEEQEVAGRVVGVQGALRHSGVRAVVLSLV